METKLNIAKILKDCPSGTKLYSPLFGDCVFNRVEFKEDGTYTIKVTVLSGNLITNNFSFNSDGTYMCAIDRGVYSGIGECLLFPSKDNRDWSKFKIEKPEFNVNILKLIYNSFYGG